MTKEEKRKSILKLYQAKSISLDDALDMLEAIDTVSNETPIETLYQKQTYSDAIEQIVRETINNMDVDAVVKIMQDMKWEYYGGLATREQIITCMEDNIRSTLHHLVQNQIKENYPNASIRSGGFQCHAWVDDDDWDNIQVELYFQPYSAYGEGHLDYLIKLKEEENL